MAKELAVIEGIPALESALRRKVAELHEAAAEGVREEVDAIKSDAQSRAPVDTGELRGSIEPESEGLTGTVTTTSRHAGFMEFGTSKDEAQPFMKPAAEKARKRFPARAAAIIRTALGG